MNQQIQNPVILIYDHHEKKIEHATQYLVVYDINGSAHRISEKRKQLWPLIEESFHHEALLIIYQEYQKTPYVADVRKIADELLNRAVQDIGIKLSDQATEERNRSQSIAYAKDLKCAGVLSGDMYEEATKIYQFIKTGKVAEEDEESRDRRIRRL